MGDFETPPIEESIALAASAHKGQVDKIGQPYIFHPLRVMLEMTTLDDRTVAVLHDVLEDTDSSERLSDPREVHRLRVSDLDC